MRNLRLGFAILLILLSFTFLSSCMTTQTRTVNADGTVTETTTTQPASYTVGDPWLGEGSPWAWNGANWYYWGAPYYYYGPYGWGPRNVNYNNYLVRPNQWYNNPRWNQWNHANPGYNANYRNRTGHWHNSHPNSGINRVGNSGASGVHNPGVHSGVGPGHGQPGHAPVVKKSSSSKSTPAKKSK